MIAATPASVVSQWMNAYNRHDLEEVVALYDAAATNIQ